ncbi:MAG: hypothetical protein AB7N70_01120 [Dehalococcoidia bacterium]
MIILVADTSILIDLERGDLLAAALSGPDTIATPDLLYAQELEPSGGRAMLALGLQVIELSPAEMSTTQDIYRAEGTRLSLPDCSAYVCACRNEHVLLTGDQRLRSYSESQATECHGLLWLLDRLHDNQTADAESLFDGLTRISAHRQCRLPRDEVSSRLRRWKASR